ncbi:hypothetical protein LINGRAHAP2_LOCUS30185 [Linum grandiflorum]
MAAPAAIHLTRPAPLPPPSSRPVVGILSLSISPKYAPPTSFTSSTLTTPTGNSLSSATSLLPLPPPLGGSIRCCCYPESQPMPSDSISPHSRRLLDQCRRKGSIHGCLSYEELV